MSKIDLEEPTQNIDLISYIHHTGNYKQYCHVGNKANECKSGQFQDADFAEDL